MICWGPRFCHRVADISSADASKYQTSLQHHVARHTSPPMEQPKENRRSARVLTRTTRRNPKDVQTGSEHTVTASSLAALKALWMTEGKTFIGSRNGRLCQTSPVHQFGHRHSDFRSRNGYCSSCSCGDPKVTNCIVAKMNYFAAQLFIYSSSTAPA